MSIEEQLEDYKNSEQFTEDISWYENECFLEGRPVPSDEEIPTILLAEKKAQLEAQMLCDTQGHRYEEVNADGENGRSDLDCQRCGQVFRCQW